MKGLRLRLILSLGGVMAVAFVPLFLAIASLTTAEISAAHQRTLHAVASSVGAIACSDPTLATLERLTTTAGNEVDGIAVLGPGGRQVSTAGVRSSAASGTTVTVSCAAAANVALVHSPTLSWLPGQDPAPTPASLRLVGWYMALFALALLVFLYLSMTRLIVRPLDRLVAASDQVARGAAELAVPRTGTRELDDLGRALQTMTARLRSEEEALRSKIDELTGTTERLREARDQVTRSDRLASVGRLAAGLAHEVGNPLAALLGLEDLLLDGDLEKEEQHDFLARMKKETERIHGVMRDLLDYARTETGTGAASSSGPASLRPAGDAEPTNVSAVFEDVLRLVKPQQAFRHAELEARVEDPDLTVALPAAKLTQVLLNLVMNAGQAGAATERVSERRSTSGESTSSARLRILLRARPVSFKLAVIEVEDDGPGVPSELGERIFEPFVTSKPAGEGTGLGLAVCRSLVEAAGGVLSFRPATPRGAIFRLELPR